MAPIPSYSQQDLELAVQAHQDGLSLRECQQLFSVPRDTIRRKAKEEFPTIQRPGVKPALGAEEEEYLGEWISECARRGFPRTAEHLMDEVQRIMVEDKRQNPFVKNKLNWRKNVPKKDRGGQKPGRRNSH